MSSNAAPRLQVVSVEAFERPFALRMPFRFGLYTLTQATQALVKVAIELEGGAVATGFAAEVLLAKWFDKRPELTPADNEEQLRTSLRNAAAAYRSGGTHTAFGMFANHYAVLMDAGRRQDLPPLVCGFGPATLDRAIVDGLCRHFRCGFLQALRRNLPGIEGHAIVSDMQHFDFTRFLAQLQPVQRLHARHTVGMLDALETAIDGPHDGLPVTLVDCIRAYGNTHFKLKLSGDRAWDLDRLGGIAAVLDAELPDYRVTIDGNEQFADVDALQALWRDIGTRAALKRLVASTLLIEQPVARAVALDRPMAAMSDVCPVIVDESDGTLAAFVDARRQGYRGVSTKGCKGLYKSIVNSARCAAWNAQEGAGRYFMSAEDLITQAGLGVQQDLTLAAALGIGHIERNGHHYVDGLATCGAEEAARFAAAHPDLYATSAQAARLRIDGGLISAASSGNAMGFGTSVVPLTAADTQMAGLA